MSTIEQAYEQVGGNYQDVLKRLMNEALVRRFMGKFLDDTSFASLKEGLQEKDVDKAFMAAHTLKGVCLNLGFLKLFEPTNEITEVLRVGSLEGTEELFAQVEAEYNNVVDALNSCL